MELTLMYLTNNPEVAAIAQDAGVARIVVDMEYIGKDKRQRGMNTSRNYHTIEDVKKLRPIIDKSELMVRVNPIHERTDKVISSEEEIEAVIEYGADIIMLPSFKTVQEVRTFIELVDHRAKVYPLIETPEAVDCMDEILKLDGIDEVHFGLNDLGLGYKKKFLFELLADGTVERLCSKARESGLPYGFGGIARPGYGLLPAEKIIREHFYYGSSRVILSRAFCDSREIKDMGVVRETFQEGIKSIRSVEEECLEQLRNGEKGREYFGENHKEVIEVVDQICGR